MLDGFCKLPLAQIEQFLPSIEIGRFPRLLKIPARLALVLIGWVVRHMKWSRLSEQIFRIDKWSLCQG
jgi:hypothetical protein